jgi:hypothetical protein
VQGSIVCGAVHQEQRRPVAAGHRRDLQRSAPWTEEEAGVHSHPHEEDRVGTAGLVARVDRPRDQRCHAEQQRVNAPAREPLEAEEDADRGCVCDPSHDRHGLHFVQRRVGNRHRRDNRRADGCQQVHQRARHDAAIGHGHEARVVARAEAKTLSQA